MRVPALWPAGGSICRAAMRIVAAPVVVAVVLAACAEDPAQSEISTQGSSAESGVLSGKQLPIETILILGEDELDLLHQARNLVIEKCMSEAGFDFVTFPTESWTDDLDVGFRYGYLGSGDRGYITWPSHMNESASLGASSDTSAAHDEALWGRIEADGQKFGCYHYANEEIYGTTGGVTDMPAVAGMVELQASSSNELYASRDVLDLQREWSSCMKESGYEFDEWYDAVVAVERLIGDTSPPSSAELQQAQTDSECRMSSGFELTLFEAESRLQQYALESNVGLGLQLEEEYATAVENALLIVGE